MMLMEVVNITALTNPDLMNVHAIKDIFSKTTELTAKVCIY